MPAPSRRTVWDRDRYVQIPKLLLHKTTDAQLRTYLGIAVHCDDRGRATPSLDTIQANAGFASRTTVWRNIPGLEALGLVEVERQYEVGKRHGGNTYVLPHQKRSPKKKNAATETGDMPPSLCVHGQRANECFSCTEGADRHLPNDDSMPDSEGADWHPPDGTTSMSQTPNR